MTNVDLDLYVERPPQAPSVRAAHRDSRTRVVPVQGGTLKVVQTAPPPQGASNRVPIACLPHLKARPKLAVVESPGEHRSRLRRVRVPGLCAGREGR